MDVSPAQTGSVKIDQNIQATYPFTQAVSGGPTLSLEAIPVYGYEFTNWSGDLTGTDNPTSIVMSCTKTVTANFSRKILNLTVDINGAGSVTPTTGVHSYAQGTKVTITATPNDGYQFDGWTGNVSDPSAASTTITMDTAKTVTAHFSQITYTLTIGAKGAGSVTPSIGNHSSVAGSIINITATPDPGYKFDGWIGDVNDPGSASTAVTIDAIKTVTANFSQITSTLTIQVSGAGSVTPLAGDYSYARGTVVSITATPDTGYRFDGWTGDVGDSSSAITTINLDSAKTIVANFSKIQTKWWLSGSIIAGVVIVAGGIAWIIVRKRTPVT